MTKGPAAVAVGTGVLLRGFPRLGRPPDTCASSSSGGGTWGGGTWPTCRGAGDTQVAEGLNPSSASYVIKGRALRKADTWAPC